MREGEGVASGVLESLGLNLDKIRSEATRISSQTGYTPTSSSSKTPSKTPTLDQLGIDLTKLAVFLVIEKNKILFEIIKK